MYYVLREFFDAATKELHFKHKVITMAPHRAKEFMENGLLREIGHIPPMETKPAAPEEIKEKPKAKNKPKK